MGKYRLWVKKWRKYFQADIIFLGTFILVPVCLACAELKKQFNQSKSRGQTKTHGFFCFLRLWVAIPDCFQGPSGAKAYFYRNGSTK